MKTIVPVLLAVAITYCVTTLNRAAAGGPDTQPADTKPAQTKGDSPLQLGNFSVSLAVKDLAASREFYEKLGFHQRGGDGKRWIVLQNETSIIGLFQGMFEKNTLTYNPGWDRDKNTLASFTDVRELQREFKKRGLTPKPEADESTTGPAFFMLTDPDGNPVLFDQHVPSPKK